MNQPDRWPNEPLPYSENGAAALQPRFRLAENERWYVAQTLPYQELRAEVQLRQQGFWSFLPRMIKTVRHARKMHDVKAPVFPGYIFVAFDQLRDRWQAVNSTLGVRRLIVANDRPVPVPRGLTETFIESCGVDDVMRFDGGLSSGQSVRVIRGAFVDLIGRIEQIDANGRVRILLDMMGGEVSVVLSRASLRVA
jgi:transcription elongation factor/antiterminator RfaH